MDHPRAPQRYRGVFDEPPFDTANSFYVHGSTGTGKTHYAWAIANIFNKDNSDAILKAKQFNYEQYQSGNNADMEVPKFSDCDVRNVPELMIGYRGEPFESKGWFIERLCKGNLIFDDIGAEYQSEFTQELLLAVLDARWNKALWTGFTSNLSIGNLPYGDRVKSRIAGIVGDNIYKLDGKDRRLQQK